MRFLRGVCQIRARPKAADSTVGRVSCGRLYLACWLCVLLLAACISGLFAGVLENGVYTETREATGAYGKKPALAEAGWALAKGQLPIGDGWRSTRGTMFDPPSMVLKGMVNGRNHARRNNLEQRGSDGYQEGCRFF